jgi:cellulose synthase/poly-beta-1,6-N-acetylglucosamine synthase-like glycosyltransferase
VKHIVWQARPESVSILPSRQGVRSSIDGGKFPHSGVEPRRKSNVKLADGNEIPFVVAIIPSYNEEDSIRRTIQSLRSQTIRVDEIIVLADNCDDNTVTFALSVGVSIVETVDNGDGKSGALNFLLDELLALMNPQDCIFVMDADTVLTEKFIEVALEALTQPSKKPIGGVGGIFLEDESPWNLVRQLQANEYTRYRRRLSRRRGRALVLTGTGTLFRAGVLMEVREGRRNGTLPDLGKTVGVYDTSALTEDNELTLCIKQLGYRVISPKECTVKTAMMPSWGALYKQRRRWQRGALENLIAHGFDRHTFPYGLRQLFTYLGVLMLPLYLFTLSISLAQNERPTFLEPIWLLVGVIYVAEQTFSVRRGGWKAVLVSLAVLPELFLNLFLNWVYVVSFFGALFWTSEVWGRMRNPVTADHSRNGTVFSEEEVREKIPSSALHGTHQIRNTLTSRWRAVGVILLITCGGGHCLIASMARPSSIMESNFCLCVDRHFGDGDATHPGENKLSPIRSTDIGVFLNLKQ